MPAILGEIEIPILVEKNEKIMIKINNEENNKNNLWSFLSNEKPVNYLGYQNYKYNNINIGALLLRITGDNKIYHLNKAENIINVNDRGNLLFSANINNNDYPIYEPKGSLSITIHGGNYLAENELFFSRNINCFSNKDKINIEEDKENQILDYINKARNNLKKFYYFYFCNIIEEINLEIKKYLFNYKKRKELIMCKELTSLAKKHCEELCENESSGFIRSEDPNISNKIKNYNSFGESIIYNTNNPLLIVKNLMVDKYSKKKKNRENLFEEKFNKIGIYLKEHPIYKYCCVLIFSD